MNPTGIEPVEFKVLIEVDEIDDKSAGGLYLPQSTMEREQLGCDSGTLIAVSKMAFFDWSGTVPKVGDRVIFEKYAGTLVHYRNVEQKFVGKYRLCKCEQIYAVIKEEKDGS